MWKLIKLTLLVIVVILALNWLGFLNDETSQKIDNVVSTVKTKVSNIEYGGKKVSDMTLSELSDQVGNDITNLKEKHITEDGFVLGTDRMKVTMSPTKDTLVKIELDTSDKESILSAEKVITNIIKEKYSIPEEKLNSTNQLIIKVVKNSTQEGQTKLEVIVQ